MDDDALLGALGVDPGTLAPAPEAPRTEDARTRWKSPCTVCGTPAVATTTVTTPAGPRWLDSCRDHMLTAARLRSAPAA